MNALYELDPKWKKLLNSSNFLGGLTVNEFVEELSKDHFTKRNDGDDYDGKLQLSMQNLDPKPYIRTFESTLKELETLNQEAQSKKEQLIEEVSSEELNHAYKITQLSKKLKQNMLEYDHLDNKLSGVIQVIGPLGEKVENAIRTKKAYIKSVELIAEYNEFYQHGESSHIEKLKNSDNWQLKTQAVILLKSLLALASKIETSSIPKTLSTTKTIQKYCEKLENELLERFNAAYRENNFTQLNAIALILDYYNGGVNVIQSFINQHSYFIDTELINDVDNETLQLDDSIKIKLVDVDFHGIIYEKNIVQKLSEIEAVIKNESKVVKRVFEERAPHVIQLFIQRIFVQKIESKIEFLLQSAVALSDLAFVRMLHSLYSLMRDFVKDLSEFFKLLEIDNDNNLLAATIENCYSDLFSKYLFDRSRYFDIEKRSLESILIEKTSTLNISHEKEIKFRLLSNKFNKRLEKGIDYISVNPNNKLNDSQHKSTITGIDYSKRKLSQINNFFKTHLDKEKLTLSRSNSSNHREFLQSHDSTTTAATGNVVVDEDEFNIDIANSMLKCVVESMARVMELTPNKASNSCYELLELLYIGLVSSYVETGLEIAFYHIAKLDSTLHHSGNGSSNNVGFSNFNATLPGNNSSSVSRNASSSASTMLEVDLLKYVSISTEILNLLSASIKAVFLPLLTNSPEIKKKVIEMTNNQLKRCELLINITLEEMVNFFSTVFKTTLDKQNKKDFIPASQDLFDQDTLPAMELVTILTSIYSQSSLYLKSKNLELFLTSIGDCLYNLLLAHYSKFQVSSIGGIIVTKDIIGLQNIIDDWGITELTEKFATLRELANLFTVQPDLLGSLTKEGHLAGVDKNIISSYVTSRQDFAQDGGSITGRFGFR